MDIKPYLVFISIFVSVLAVQTDQISAKRGQKVILPCTAPSNDRVTTVEWRRTEMDTEYVLSYRNSKYDPTEQSSCFSKRVELQDEQMKNGNVSLVLKDVRTNDSGTYESRITQKDKNDKKTHHLDGEPICIFQLSVAAASDQHQGTKQGESKDTGAKNGRFGSTVCQMVVVVVCSLFSAWLVL
ncbi:uncharacterized protein KZ484_021421 [Pholidichthys leucotaenia]